jgi:hypothetical protein
MAQQLYAVLDGTSHVTNIVSWDGGASWAPPAGSTAVLTHNDPKAVVGASYAGGVFTPPVVTPGQVSGVLSIAPATGFNIALPNAPQPKGLLIVVMQPLATLAAGTLVLPPAPLDLDLVKLFTTHTITALTVSPNTGQVANNMPTTLAALALGTDIYWSAQYGAWFRL